MEVNVGDFVNDAKVRIIQFIARGGLSGQRACGLVMLLRWQEKVQGT